MVRPKLTHSTCKKTQQFSPRPVHTSPWGDYDAQRRDVDRTYSRTSRSRSSHNPVYNPCPGRTFHDTYKDYVNCDSHNPWSETGPRSFTPFKQKSEAAIKGVCTPTKRGKPRQQKKFTRSPLKNNDEPQCSNGTSDSSSSNLSNRYDVSPLRLRRKDDLMMRTPEQSTRLRARDSSYQTPRNRSLQGARSQAVSWTSTNTSSPPGNANDLSKDFSSTKKSRKPSLESSPAKRIRRDNSKVNVSQKRTQKTLHVQMLSKEKSLTSSKRINVSSNDRYCTSSKGKTHTTVKESIDILPNLPKGRIYTEKRTYYNSHSTVKKKTDTSTKAGISASKTSDILTKTMTVTSANELGCLSGRLRKHVSSNDSLPTSASSSTPTSSNDSLPTSASSSTPTSASSSTPTSSNDSLPISASSSTPTSANDSLPISASSSTPTSSNDSLPISASSSTPTSANDNLSISAKEKTFVKHNEGRVEVVDACVQVNVDLDDLSNFQICLNPKTNTRVISSKDSPVRSFLRRQSVNQCDESSLADLVRTELQRQKLGLSNPNRNLQNLYNRDINAADSMDVDVDADDLMPNICVPNTLPKQQMTDDKCKSGDQRENDLNCSDSDAELPAMIEEHIPVSPGLDASPDSEHSARMKTGLQKQPILIETKGNGDAMRESGGSENLKDVQYSPHHETDKTRDQDESCSGTPFKRRCYPLRNKTQVVEEGTLPRKYIKKPRPANSLKHTDNTQISVASKNQNVNTSKRIFSDNETSFPSIQSDNQMASSTHSLDDPSVTSSNNKSLTPIVIINSNTDSSTSVGEAMTRREAFLEETQTNTKSSLSEQVKRARSKLRSKNIKPSLSKNEERVFSRGLRLSTLAQKEICSPLLVTCSPQSDDSVASEKHPSGCNKDNVLSNSEVESTCSSNISEVSSSTPSCLVMSSRRCSEEITAQQPLHGHNNELKVKEGTARSNATRKRSHNKRSTRCRKSDIAVTKLSEQLGCELHLSSASMVTSDPEDSESSKKVKSASQNESHDKSERNNDTIDNLEPTQSDMESKRLNIEDNNDNDDNGKDKSSSILHDILCMPPEAPQDDTDLLHAVDRSPELDAAICDSTEVSERSPELDSAIFDTSESSERSPERRRDATVSPKLTNIVQDTPNLSMLNTTDDYESWRAADGKGEKDEFPEGWILQCNSDNEHTIYDPPDHVLDQWCLDNDTLPSATPDLDRMCLENDTIPTPTTNQVLDTLCLEDDTMHSVVSQEDSGVGLLPFPQGGLKVVDYSCSEDEEDDSLNLNDGIKVKDPPNVTDISSSYNEDENLKPSKLAKEPAQQSFEQRDSASDLDNLGQEKASSSGQFVKSASTQKELSGMDDDSILWEEDCSTDQIVQLLNTGRAETPPELCYENSNMTTCVDHDKDLETGKQDSTMEISNLVQCHSKRHDDVSDKSSEMLNMTCRHDKLVDQQTKMIVESASENNDSVMTEDKQDRHVQDTKAIHPHSVIKENEDKTNVNANASSTLVETYDKASEDSGVNPFESPMVLSEGHSEEMTVVQGIELPLKESESARGEHAVGNTCESAIVEDGVINDLDSANGNSDGKGNENLEIHMKSDEESDKNIEAKDIDNALIGNVGISAVNAQTEEPDSAMMEPEGKSVENMESNGQENDDLKNLGSTIEGTEKVMDVEVVNPGEPTNKKRESPRKMGKEGESCVRRKYGWEGSLRQRPARTQYFQAGKYGWEGSLRQRPARTQYFQAGMNNGPDTREAAASVGRKTGSPTKQTDGATPRKNAEDSSSRQTTPKKQSPLQEANIPDSSSPPVGTKAKAAAPTKPLNTTPTKPSSKKHTKPSSMTPTKTLNGTPTKTLNGTPTKTLNGTPTKTSSTTPTKSSSGTPTKPSSMTPTKPFSGTPVKKRGDGSPTKVAESIVLENDEEVSRVVEVEANFGQLVWARLSGERWWPGLVIKGTMIYLQSEREAASWVYWFGDHKVSQVSHDKIVFFVENYRQKLGSFKSKLYRKAVLEALIECGRREGSDRMESSDETQLLQWAESGFPSTAAPESPADLNPSPDSPVPDCVLGYLSQIGKDIRRKAACMDFRKASEEEQESAVTVVRRGDKNIQDICIACSDLTQTVAVEHPLFKGGLCRECQNDVIETMYAIGEDGLHSFCAVCGSGGDLFVCDTPGCKRVYCRPCVEELCGDEVLNQVIEASKWQCFLCTPLQTTDETTDQSGCLLHPHKDWQERLIMFFDTGYRVQVPCLDYFTTKRPLRVLSLYDGIGSGKLTLDQLGFQVGAYYASEIDKDAILVTQCNHGDTVTQVGDVTKLDSEKLSAIGPIDLLLGGSPCNDLSLANPARRGFQPDSTALLFFDFVRIRDRLQELNTDTHLFWLYENVASMKTEFKKTMSRFLNCEPALWDSKYVSAQRRGRYFWGNLPGMYSTPAISTHMHENVGLDSVLEQNCHRRATIAKMGCITTRTNSLKHGKKDQLFPVEMEGEASGIWIPEVERLFGFPPHYTDMGNLPVTRRHKLLGKSWSIPIIKLILRPLKKYFATVDNPATQSDD